MEKLEEIREGIDYLEVANLSRQIMGLAEEGAVLAQRLASDELSEEDRDDLGSKLTEVVNKGTELSEKRSKIFARY